MNAIIRLLQNKYLLYTAGGFVAGIAVAVLYMAISFSRSVSYDTHTNTFVETISVGSIELMELDLPHSILKGDHGSSLDFDEVIRFDRRSILSPDVSPRYEGVSIYLLSQDLTVYSITDHQEVVQKILKYWGLKTDLVGHSSAADDARAYLDAIVNNDHIEVEKYDLELKKLMGEE